MKKTSGGDILVNPPLWRSR